MIHTHTFVCMWFFTLPNVVFTSPLWMLYMSWDRSRPNCFNNEPIENGAVARTSLVKTPSELLV